MQPTDVAVYDDTDVQYSHTRIVPNVVPPCGGERELADVFLQEADLDALNSHTSSEPQYLTNTLDRSGLLL